MKEKRPSPELIARTAVALVLKTLADRVDRGAILTADDLRKLARAVEKLNAPARGLIESAMRRGRGRPSKKRLHIKIARNYRTAARMRDAGDIDQAQMQRFVEFLARVEHGMSHETVRNIASKYRADADTMEHDLQRACEALVQKVIHEK